MTQRLQSFLLLFVFPLGLASSACDCGSVQSPECVGAEDASECAEGICCGEVCLDTSSICPPGYACSEGACTADGVSCDCEPLPPLAMGRMADDLDSTVQADGTYVLSGYSPGVPQGFDRYGDLVVGSYNSETQAVRWSIVDGVPTDGEVEADPSGWRGGVVDPGPDVGRYSSIEAIGDDLIVAYTDVDNGSLKIATRIDDEWETYELDEGANMVAWTSMTIDNFGLPVISYVVYSAPPIGKEQPQSSLRIARPNLPLPNADLVDLGDAGLPSSVDSDDTVVDLGNGWQWTITEIDEGEMKCPNQNFCSEGYFCTAMADGTCAYDTDDCDVDPETDNGCPSSSPVCFNGECLEIKRASDYISAEGMYMDIERTSTGLALVYYDRTTGNIFGRSCAADPCDSADDWGVPFLIDGWSSYDPENNPHSGDCGVGASLFVDQNDLWHVTYVDSTWEELRYTTILNDTVLGFELVDDGSNRLTGLLRDQLHIVGDDSSVVAVETITGIKVRVAYVDATAHTTVLATRSADTAAWTYELLSPSNPDGQAFASVTAAPASNPLSYVGAQWLIIATTDNTYLSNTDVFPIGLSADTGSD